MSEENQNEEVKEQLENSEASEETQAAASPEEEILALKQKIEELTKENADLNDQVLRRAADFENYRRRAIQEKQDAFDYGNAALLTDLLGVIDNFDRTLEAAKTATDPKSIADGVEMINKSFMNMLETKYNLKAYGAEGDAFDPSIHEAIGSCQEAVAEPVLKAVYLKGYKLKEKAIRLAKVMVSMPDGSVKAEEKPAEENPAEENK